MLNSQEKRAIQRTFELIVPLADTFAVLFYDRFFSLEPAARSLFKGNMASQREKVMDMLSLTVRGLDEPYKTKPELHNLGQRHMTYRVEDWHYPLMNEAIVWALAECLGDRFTDEIRSGWTQALDSLADTMLNASDPHSPNLPAS